MSTPLEPYAAPVRAPVANPPVTWGITSTFGALTTLVALIGGVIAAIKANDVATATAGGASVVAAVATIIMRGQQAVALIDAAAPFIHSALPVIASAVDALEHAVDEGEFGDTGPGEPSTDPTTPPGLDTR